jgi:hypothetical protein
MEEAELSVDEEMLPLESLYGCLVCSALSSILFQTNSCSSKGLVHPWMEVTANAHA